jgi:hypothetical protein
MAPIETARPGFCPIVELMVDDRFPEKDVLP